MAVLEQINFVLTLIFIAEMVVKIIGPGLAAYCQDIFNIFDAMIVVVSVLEWILEESDNSSGLSALRTFRLFRVLKLARSWGSLRQLLSTIAKSVSDVGNFGLLLFLLMYIFSLIGMQFFANRFHFDPADGKPVTWEPHIYNTTTPPHAPWTHERPYRIPRSNFDDLPAAFLTIFQILTGEDWNKVMYDGMTAIGWPAAAFFVAIVVIGNLIVLNLFLAILLGNFDTNAPLPESELDMAAQALSRTGTLMKQQSLRALNNKTKKKRMGAQDRALFLFSPTHPIRHHVSRVAQSKLFEHGILVLICVSSVALALDNPLNDPSSDMARALTRLDSVLTALFSIEMAIKIIHAGFVLNGPASYLRDGWNLLDFSIVGLSWASVSFNNPSLKSIRSLRALRALRPLRLISRAPGMKRVVNALLSSIPSILNIVLVCILFFLIFGILGVFQFKGRFYACDMSSFSRELKRQLHDTYGFSSIAFKQPFSAENCTFYGGEWVNSGANFDNVGKAMMALFEMSTTEGWVDLMHQGVDATDIGFHPVENYHRPRAIFFVLFIVVGNFFALNLFVGAVIDNFNRMRESSGMPFLLSETQKEWVMVKEMMIRAKLTPKITRPVSVLGGKCFDVWQHPSFAPAIAIFVLLNTITLGMHHFQQSESMRVFLEGANIFFWFIFLLEAGIKLAVLKTRFFYNGWNVFDLAVVIGSSVSVILALFPGHSGRVHPAANAARAFRMGLALKLMKKAKTMQDLFNTITVNLPALMNVSAVMGLMLFVYSIMGVQLFAGVALQEHLNDHANFKSFGAAFVTLFRFTTGEGWNAVMYDLLIQDSSRCVDQPTFDQVQAARVATGDATLTIGCSPGTAATYLYFMSFTLVTTYVMLNLFVAVILEGFEGQSSNADLALTNEDFACLVATWQSYDPMATHWVSDHDFLKILRDLPVPLGVGDVSRKELERLALALDVPVVNGHVHFADVCLGLSKHILQQVATSRGDKIDFTIEGLKQCNHSDNNNISTYQETWAAKKIQSIARQRVARKRIRAIRKE